MIRHLLTKFIVNLTFWSIVLNSKILNYGAFRYGWISKWGYWLQVTFLYFKKWKFHNLPQEWWLSGWEGMPYFWLASPQKETIDAITCIQKLCVDVSHFLKRWLISKHSSFFDGGPRFTENKRNDNNAVKHVICTTLVLCISKTQCTILPQFFWDLVYDLELISSGPKRLVFC